MVYQFYYYHWVETSTGGLLLLEGIIRLVVSVSVLTWFITFITITEAKPLLVDYYSSRVASAQ